MLYVKNGLGIEIWGDGGASVLESLGYKSEELVRSDHQKQIKRQKLMAWIELNRCDVCGRSGKACICPV